jgi:hypothetical protein
MNDQLAELQARRIVKKLNQLREEVRSFGANARLLNLLSPNIDSRDLMHEADSLLEKLLEAQKQFQHTNSGVTSLNRKLSSNVPQFGGPSPAAKWGSEFRAGSKRFAQVASSTELDLKRLYGTAFDGMNNPTRTSTGDPSDIFDVLMTLIDALNRWIEHRNRLRAKSAAT